MDSVPIFALASRQAEWLSNRQVAVAGNIANANVPGHKAVDTVPFAEALKNAASVIAATDPRHIGGQDGTQYSQVVQETGKGVSLETELVKSGEVRSAFELNTAIASSFHRMILMTAKP